MAISNSILNSAQQMTGVTAAVIGNGGTSTYQYESTFDHNKHTNIRITHAENGFIVEVGSEARLLRKYIAKDMDEVRDLITSDMVTQRMEGK